MTGQNEIQKNIAFIFVCVYAAECVLGCSGHWLQLGSVSIRIVLFCLTLVLCLPLIIRKAGNLVVNISVISAVVFSIFLGCAYIRGKYMGNDDNYIWSDISSYLGLAILPCVLSVTEEKRNSVILVDVIYYASVLLSAVTVIIHYALSSDNVFLALEINDFLLTRSMGGLGLYESGIFRVYFRSQFFLQFSAIIGMKKILGSNGIKLMILEFFEGTLFFAIILSFTRGFWMGIVSSAVLMFIINWKCRKELFKAGIASLLMFAALVGLSCVLYGKPIVIQEVIKRLDLNLVVLTDNDEIDLDYFYDVYGITAEENITAVTIRKKTLGELKKLIVANPILGYGLGKNLDGIRLDGKTEYMYMDIMLKTGLFGLLSFLWLCLYPSGRYIFNIKKRNYNGYTGYAICGFLGVMLTSTFNPFLSTPMGMLLFSAVCGLVFNTETDNNFLPEAIK